MASIWIRAAVIAACSIPAVASADRAPVLGVDASAMGGGTDFEHSTMGGLRFGLHLAWERERPAMPELPGYAVGWQVVPEALVARWNADDPKYVDNLAQVGARLQLDVTQNRMGLLEISAYTGLYLAARVGAWTGRGQAVASGAFGSFVYIGDSHVRLGFEVGVLGWRDQAMGKAPVTGSIGPVDGPASTPALVDDTFVAVDITAELAVAL